MKSNYVGVFYRADIGKFRAYIQDRGKIEYLGNFMTGIDAAKKYDSEVILRGLDRKINFPVIPHNPIPNTKLIQLTRSSWAVVDDEDFERVNQYNWSIDHHEHTDYAVSHIFIDSKLKRVRMHSFVMDAKDLGIDHRNGNGLHNYKSNLRECIHRDNLRNQRKTNKSVSKYKGAYKMPNRNGYSSSIGCDGKRLYLGYFKSELDAARAYDAAAIKYFGEFANINFPKQ